MVGPLPECLPLDGQQAGDKRETGIELAAHHDGIGIALEARRREAVNNFSRRPAAEDLQPLRTSSTPIGMEQRRAVHGGLEIIAADAREGHADAVVSEWHFRVAAEDAGRLVENLEPARDIDLARHFLEQGHGQVDAGDQRPGLQVEIGNVRLGLGEIDAQSQPQPVVVEREVMADLADMRLFPLKGIGRS